MPAISVLLPVRDAAPWLRASGSSARRRTRPSRPTLATVAAPLVLVFGAAPARDRWREVLSAAGLIEMSDFVFVA